MDTDKYSQDPLELRIEVAVLRERQKHLEEKILLLEGQSKEKINQLEKQLEQNTEILRQKERDLEHLNWRYADLNAKHLVLETNFRHAQDELAKSSRATARKSLKARLLGVAATVVFLVASALSSYAVNMFSSVPPNPSLGWLLMAGALILSLIGSIITIIYVPEGEK